MDKYDEFTSHLEANEVTYAAAARILGISVLTLSTWLREAQIEKLRPNAFRQNWSITKDGFAQLLRVKQVPLSRLRME